MEDVTGTVARAHSLPLRRGVCTSQDGGAYEHWHSSRVSSLHLSGSIL